MAESKLPLEISGIQVRLVENGTDGLLGWASFVLSGAVRMNSVAIRRGRDMSLFLTFPGKRHEGSGTTHHYFYPISREAAEALQNAVLTQLTSLAQAAQAQEDRAS
ncbi:MAG: hypothetical protein AB7V45_09665 [Candidatus Krumholzibacteriia bacterium]